MKKLYFLIAVFCTLQVTAQTYYVDFFAFGESSTIDSIQILNLSTAEAITINGDDVLAVTPTGVSENIADKSALTIQPNPMQESATIIVDAPVAGDAVISISDITGQVVAQAKAYIETSQSFEITGLNSGLYLVNVTGNAYKLSAKLLSSGISAGNASIKETGENLIAKVTKASASKGSQAEIDFDYAFGQKLKFTAFSDIYSTVVVDTIADEDKSIFFEFVACTDGSGNNYPVVEINFVKWMAKNLNTSKYNDGADITLFTGTDVAWGELVAEDGKSGTAAYSDYNNDPAISEVYGKLYNGLAAIDARICPTGWELPDTAILNPLDRMAKPQTATKLKAIGTDYWTDNAYVGTDIYGFEARGAGMRHPAFGFSFAYQTRILTLWTSTVDEVGDGSLQNQVKYFDDTHDVMLGFSGPRWDGLSIRCIKSATK